MRSLQLNEHYTSIQGEGPHVGVLTQFIRFSGCNMRCAGWPCDTQHAIQPALWRNDPKHPAGGVALMALRERDTTGASHICITGGEPFMQDASSLADLVGELRTYGFTLDVFTNGSFAWPLWAAAQFVSINLDWKLEGSGEGPTQYLQRQANARSLGPKDAVKFVIKTKKDLDEAMTVAATEDFGCPIYVGRVWDAEFTDDQLVNAIKQFRLPWRLNVQLHKYVFPNQDRGI